MPPPKSKRVIVLRSGYSSTNIIADLGVTMEASFTVISQLQTVNTTEDSSVTGDESTEFEMAFGFTAGPVGSLTVGLSAEGDNLASGVSMDKTSASTTTVPRGSAGTVTPIAAPDAHYERVWQQPALNGATEVVDQVVGLDVRVKADTGYTVTQTVTSTAPAALVLTYAWLDSNGVPQVSGTVTLSVAATVHGSYTLGDVTVTDDPPEDNARGQRGGRRPLRKRLRELAREIVASLDIDPNVLAHARAAVERGAAAHSEWQASFEAWQTGNPEGAALLERIEAKTLPSGVDAALPVFEAGKDVSTRAASGKVLNALGPVLPELWGGSADLAESNNTTIEGNASFIPSSRSTESWKGNPYGRVLHFGIREHAAASIVNGISLHGRTRAFSGTFLIFSDYQRPAIRLSALMGVPSIYVWSHDSIGLGEDGPTHQPVEQISTLRAIPGLDVVRPGDANEVPVAWKTILQNHENPAGIVLTRQNIPTYARGAGTAQGDTFGSAAGVAQGGYVLAEASQNGATVPAQVLLIATGSEVQLAVEAREALQAQGIATRVVSMPCVEWFNKQDAAYRESVLPAAVKARVSVEAGLALGWKEFVGDAGRSISLEHYGASADYKRLFQEFGITTAAITAAAKDSLAAAGD